MTDNPSNSVAQIIEAVTNTTTDLAALTPPIVKRSLLKSIVALVAGIFEIPAAGLESVSQRIRDRTAAHSLITLGTAKASAEMITSDPELLGRATQRLAGDLIRSQKNRETIAKLVVDDLKAAPPQEDSEIEIDDDWLNMFSRIAEQRSAPEMQAYLAKILAGEIRRPGSFDPSTIQIVSTITAPIANSFQRLCSLMFVFNEIKLLTSMLFCGPFGSPKSNALKPFQLPFSTLTKLQDAGLLKHELSTWQEIAAVSFLTDDVALGNERLTFEPDTGYDGSMTQRCSVLLLTTPGEQLRPLVASVKDDAFLEASVKWVQSTFHVRRT